MVVVVVMMMMIMRICTYLPTCLMYSTGCPSSSGSCSVLVPWSGGVSWVLLRPTPDIFAVLPSAPEVAVHFAHLEQGLLFVPFARTSATQGRAFSVVGPSVWNGLPLAQRLLPRILSDTFYSSLKTLLFSRARAGSASEQ